MNGFSDAQLRIIARDFVGPGMTLSGSDVRATVVPRVGPVKAAFSGKETLADNRIIGEGAGGVAGFAKGGAKVRREEESPDVTILRDETEAQTGGKLAQLGSRLIDSTSRKLAANFFENFATLVAPSS
ncbi:SRPBCC domain-containing protein [Bradyrhizobium sp. CCGUVB1N3]|uniref:SRPBCC domain-containing protein n=1 Tax=Bradyrhizobium sp. CCGUVB1N3 TaxID=2949629 RepID=UPI003532062F